MIGKPLSVQEWELLSLFEVEPVLREPGEAWIFNEALYEIQEGNVGLSCALDILHHDLRLIITCNGSRTYELNALGIVDAIYRNEVGKESLTIIVSDLEEIILRVKPQVVVEQRIRESETQ